MGLRCPVFSPDLIVFSVLWSSRQCNDIFWDELSLTDKLCPLHDIVSCCHQLCHSDIKFVFIFWDIKRLTFAAQISPIAYFEKSSSHRETSVMMLTIGTSCEMVRLNLCLCSVFCKIPYGSKCSGVFWEELSFTGRLMLYCMFHGDTCCVKVVFNSCLCCIQTIMKF